MSSVILFGPTGNIGSVAAVTAEENGAKVFLAMRDTKKSIPGLSAEREKSGRFERVQADMTKPETVGEAVKTSGAKRAFIYLAHGSPDHMKSTLEALKSNGIEFVVFLSSYTIWAEPREIEQKDLISWIHAQVEINLEEVFGVENFVAVRPGFFATNILRYKAGITSGEVDIWGGGFQGDCITPTDMGQVSGTILAKGPKKNQHIVFLYGPEFISQGEACKRAGKVFGNDVKLKPLSEEAAVQQYVDETGSKFFAEYLVHSMSDPGVYPETPLHFTHYEEGVENVKLYLGRPSTKFADWVKANQHMFTS